MRSRHSSQIERLLNALFQDAQVDAQSMRSLSRCGRPAGVCRRRKPWQACGRCESQIRCQCYFPTIQSTAGGGELCFRFAEGFRAQSLKARGLVSNGWSNTAHKKPGAVERAPLHPKVLYSSRVVLFRGKGTSVAASNSSCIVIHSARSF